MKNIEMIYKFATLLIVLGLFSCKKEKNNMSEEDDSRYAFLKVGNYWIYERYTEDNMGNITSMNIIDSCFVEKDTLMNNKKFYKLVGPQPHGIIISNTYIRDSSNYLVNHKGQILYSSQNFEDTFYQFYVEQYDDTICKGFVKMDEQELTTTLPFGDFVTNSQMTTYLIYPKFVTLSNIKHSDIKFSNKIGIISETFPPLIRSDKKIKRLLIRYNLN